MKKAGIIIDTGGKDIKAQMQKLILKRVRFHFNTSLNFQEVADDPKFKGKFKLLPTNFSSEDQYATISKKVSNIPLKSERLCYPFWSFIAFFG